MSPVVQNWSVRLPPRGLPPGPAPAGQSEGVGARVEVRRRVPCLRSIALMDVE